MRLWSLAPAQLDRAALVAGWREGLLAQKVLSGSTLGYRNHPQLQRFRAHPHPDRAIAAWLLGLADEAERRAYRFDRSKIVSSPCSWGELTVTTGQLELERIHLLGKVRQRQPNWIEHLAHADSHPLFCVVQGAVEPWERASVGTRESAEHG